MINQIFSGFFLVYTLMLAVRIISSWIPEFSRHPWILFIAQFTDPYLNFFRKIIPPIGGVLDLSPILAFLTLRFVKYLLQIIFK